MLKQIFLGVVLILLSACATQAPWEKTNPQAQAQAYSNRGFGYLEQGQTSRALQDFQRALNVQPHYLEALHGTALALQEQQEFELAEGFFKQALKHKGETTAIRNDYAVFLFQQERYQEAHKQLEKASQNIYYSSRNIVLANLGYVSLELHQPKAAIQYFEQSLAIDPSFIILHQELLQLYSSEFRWQEAEKHWFKLRDANLIDIANLRLALQVVRQTGNNQEESYVLSLLKSFD